MAPTAQLTATHRANRLQVVADVSKWLIKQHAERMPDATYTEVIDAALAMACGMTDAQWIELGQTTGHYLGHGATPDDDTIADILRHLERLLPTEKPAAAGDPFAGLPTY